MGKKNKNESTINVALAISSYYDPNNPHNTSKRDLIQNLGEWIYVKTMNGYRNDHVSQSMLNKFTTNLTRVQITTKLHNALFLFAKH